MTQITGKTTLGSPNNQAYIKLLQAFPPRPIASEEDYQTTQIVIDLLIYQGSLTSEEQDYLNVLGCLIRDYEDLYYPFN